MGGRQRACTVRGMLSLESFASMLVKGTSRLNCARSKPRGLKQPRYTFSQSSFHSSALSSASRVTSLVRGRGRGRGRGRVRVRVRVRSSRDAPSQDVVAVDDQEDEVVQDGEDVLGVDPPPLLGDARGGARDPARVLGLEEISHDLEDRGEHLARLGARVRVRVRVRSPNPNPKLGVGFEGRGGHGERTEAYGVTHGVPGLGEG